LKGAAQVVRREDMAGAAHRLETLLDTLGHSPAAPGALESSLSIAAEMTARIGSTASAPGPKTTPAVSVRAHADPEIETLRIDLHELDRLLQSVNESVIVASGIRGIFVLLERARDLAAMVGGRQSSAANTTRAAHAEVLADEIGDVIEEARRELEAATDHVQRELEEIRAQTESLRLVRAESIVDVLRRSVEAVSAASGKSARFESHGEDLEVDAHLLIAARDALIQMARNAVAHGIEDTADRVAAGKPARGTVRADFRREGSRTVFSIQDDGRGIDFEALRTLAVKRGWLSANQAVNASEQELTHFLLRPGVTTASAPNVLAGRGIGLDLVRDAVARLKGELRISAEAGKGTIVEMHVPASLNSVSVLMVKAAGMVVGLPRDVVTGTASVASLERLADLYMIKGRALPMASLASVLGREADAPSVAIEIAAQPQAFLLGVDGLLGIRQTVIYSLPAHMQAEPWVLGASIEAEGKLRLVLDPALFASKLEELGRRPPSTAAETAAPLPILVIDDSLTTRMLEQSIFEMEGYTVDLASSAEEALKMAARRRYGLFLVDVEMPGMDGYSFVERTLQTPGLRDTPAILVTSRGSAEDRARGLAAGAREYIVKSEFDQRHLLNRVRELMRAR
jgi:two-component system chemotaxis sensor kinase CheA